MSLLLLQKPVNKLVELGGPFDVRRVSACSGVYQGGCDIATGMCRMCSLER
jgi:hypothetical protein